METYTLLAIGFFAGACAVGIVVGIFIYLVEFPIRKIRTQIMAAEQTGNDPVSLMLAFLMYEVMGSYRCLLRQETDQAQKSIVRVLSGYYSFIAKQSCRSSAAQRVFDEFNRIRNDSEEFRRQVLDCDKTNERQVLSQVVATNEGLLKQAVPRCVAIAVGVLCLAFAIVSALPSVFLLHAIIFSQKVIDWPVILPVLCICLASSGAFGALACRFFRGDKQRAAGALSDRFLADRT